MPETSVSPIRGARFGASTRDPPRATTLATEPAGPAASLPSHSSLPARVQRRTRPGRCLASSPTRSVSPHHLHVESPI